MSGTWGNSRKLSIFGESHGPVVGITIHGLPAGILLDIEQISRELNRRKPGQGPLCTGRKETDEPHLISGFFQGRTTGEPLCCLMENQDAHSGDYEGQQVRPRPGHSDYPEWVRTDGWGDYRGGGHFSGRLTAPLVFAGAVCKQLLARKEIQIAAHIQQIGGVSEGRFRLEDCEPDCFRALQDRLFPLLDPTHEEAMKRCIAHAKAEQDSVGGVIECGAIGLPVGIGEPFFDSMESTLSHLLFSIPGVKGVEFGDGFSMAEKVGSQCKDEYYYEGAQVRTVANHNGGIVGGLTTGMPLIFRTAIKPTPSIGQEQRTVDLKEQRETVLRLTGRHDPCIVPRAVVVVEAVCAIGLCQFL